MKREFNRIAVTDRMLEVIRAEVGTTELGAESLMRRVFAGGGLGMVRAKGPYLSEDQIAKAENGIPSDEEARQVRMQCLHLLIAEGNVTMTANESVIAADILSQYVLTGSKPSTGGE